MNEKITAYDAEILALEQLKINADEPLRAAFSETQEKLRVAKSTAVENRERKKAGRKPLPESEADATVFQFALPTKNSRFCAVERKKTAKNSRR